ncbi:hypothetical protein Pst134EB_024887 [Puccinia striiformis f. sp. tritici]|nr:hypothetical protein Pst134EB_024887 [Puccinia striiformis f. sp. tritici]
MLSFYLLVVVFAMVCKDAIATCGPGAKRACDVVINKRPRIGPFPFCAYGPSYCCPSEAFSGPPISWPTPENKVSKGCIPEKK